MRTAVAHNPRPGRHARSIGAAALLVAVVCGAPFQPTMAGDATTEPVTTQPTDTQPALTQPAATQPRSRSVAVATQPAAETTATTGAPNPPAASTATTTGSAAENPTAHMPEWTQFVGVFVLFAVLLSVLIYAWKVSRDKALQKLSIEDDEPTFTLDELRQLRDSGQLSQEEFLRARALVVEKERRRHALDEQADDQTEA